MHLGFEPDPMRSAARTIDSIRMTVENDLVRATSAGLPAMPPHVAADVRTSLAGLQSHAHASSHALQSVPDELRFRAFLAELADSGGNSPHTPLLTWKDLLGVGLGGIGDGLERFGEYWKQWTRVTGHWRAIPGGTRTWVKGHWRNIGHDIASHADDAKYLRLAGKAFKVIGVIPDALDVVSAFHAPPAKRNEAVGKASGKAVGGVVGGIAGGALLGATIGSVIPGAGTVVGGVAGAIIAGGIGAIAGSKLGEWGGGVIGRHADDIKDFTVNAAKKAGEVAHKAADGAKKALSSLNPF
ncbi:MAG: hypothetical protein QOG15_664 [Solirubrobacteraceae bacterium]|nr:hypothetical protein [Solirubrobacteraceae bacterium]